MWAIYSSTCGGLVRRGSAADFRNVLVLSAEKQERLRKVRKPPNPRCWFDVFVRFRPCRVEAATTTSACVEFCSFGYCCVAVAVVARSEARWGLAVTCSSRAVQRDVRLVLPDVADEVDDLGVDGDGVEVAVAA